MQFSKSFSPFFKKLAIAQLIVTCTLILSFTTSLSAKHNSSASYNKIDEKTKEINVNINLNQNDFVYQDYINISCDNPQIEIVSWSTDATPVKYFSKEFRGTKNIFNKDFVIKIKTINNSTQQLQDAHLHISYYLNSKNSIVEETVPFNEKVCKNSSNQSCTKCTDENCTCMTCKNCEQKTCQNCSCQACEQNGASSNINTGANTNAAIKTENVNALENNSESGNLGNTKLNDSNTNSESNAIDKSKTSNTQHEGQTQKEKQGQSWTQYLQNLLKTTGSIWIRILLALLLGVLLSLTPCIYPMIPITVGIIQSHGSKSFISNLFLSLVYTMGIAMTFAILGLIAAFTGAIFGTILSNPIFVMAIVAILIYLALSMFGFYEIYMPKFMRATGDTGAKKSILSVFLLGIVSGSIASPCVSPGLILLLSIVTAIGSKLLGFILLFAFGLGLGTPLIIAGTFSGSINKLPRAGMWMLEIKKIFGLLIFGVCFYFLGNILPTQILNWIMAVFMMFVGVFYLYTIKPYDSKFWKLFKNIVGVACCTISIMLIFNIYKEKYITQNIQNTQDSQNSQNLQNIQATKFWQEDFDAALAQAKKENKKLFIDLTTDACSICKAIANKVFTKEIIINELKDKFVNVKIMVTDMSKEPFASLTKKYKILGFPTFLLIDPNTDEVIKRWSSEFYYMSEADLVKLFNTLK